MPEQEDSSSSPDSALELTLQQIREKQRELRRERMAEPLVRDLWIPNHANAAANVIQPSIAANNFEIKPALITMVQQSRFGGSAMEDPHEHITQFLEYCNTVKINGVPADSIRL